MQVHTHLEQWAANAVAPGEQLGVRCPAQESHLSCGQFLPEPRFEPTTSGYKSDALSIRTRLQTTAYSFAIKLILKAETLFYISANNPTYILSVLKMG